MAFVSGAVLGVTAVDAPPRILAAELEQPSTVTWGSADFIAAEEMQRQRGYWWSPDGTVIAACRVDVADVQVWHIANPAEPSLPPAAVRYPAAGTPNPEVTLHLVPIDGSAPTEVTWHRDRFPYLAQVHWTEHALTIMVQSRDQRDLEVLVVDVATGTTTTAFADHDDAWVELVPGTGVMAAPDTLVTCADRDGARRLVVNGQPVTPADLQVRAIVDIDPERVIFTANPIGEATVQHVYRWAPGALVALADGPAIHHTVASGDVVVLRSATIDEPGARWRLPGGRQLDRNAERPLVHPRVSLLGDTAVLLPSEHDGGPLPVLLDPYGGPHAATRGAELQRLPDVAMVRRPGFRRRRRRRARHTRAADRCSSAPCSTTSPPACWTIRSPPCMLPQPSTRRSISPRRHPRLELRRVLGGPGGAAPTRRVPRRHRRGAGDRVAALRHPLHRALPR